MTLKLSKQFSNAMKRIRNENARIDDLENPMRSWRAHRSKIATCEKLSILTKKVKALKAKRANASTAA